MEPEAYMQIRALKVRITWTLHTSDAISVTADQAVFCTLHAHTFWKTKDATRGSDDSPQTLPLDAHVLSVIKVLCTVPLFTINISAVTVK